MTIINFVSLLSQYSIGSVLFKQMTDADVVKMVVVLQETVNDAKIATETRGMVRSALEVLVMCASDRECLKSTTMGILPRYSFPMLEAHVWFPKRRDCMAIYQHGTDISTLAKFGEWFYNLSDYRKAYVHEQMLDDVSYQVSFVWVSFDETMYASWPQREVFVNGAPHIHDVKALYLGDVADETCFVPHTDLEADNCFNFANKQAVMMAMVFGKLEDSVYYPRYVFDGSSHAQRFDCRATYGNKTWVRSRRGGIPYAAEVGAVEYSIPEIDENEESMSDVYWPSRVDKVAILCQSSTVEYRCWDLRAKSRQGWDYENEKVVKVKCSCVDDTHGPPPNEYDLTLKTDLLPLELDFIEGHFYIQEYDTVNPNPTYISDEEEEEEEEEYDEEEEEEEY
jgi:hypothetical protein